MGPHSRAPLSPAASPRRRLSSCLDRATLATGAPQSRSLAVASFECVSRTPRGIKVRSLAALRQRRASGSFASVRRLVDVAAEMPGGHEPALHDVLHPCDDRGSLARREGVDGLLHRTTSGCRPVVTPSARRPSHRVFHARPVPPLPRVVERHGLAGTQPPGRLPAGRFRPRSAT